MGTNGRVIRGLGVALVSLFLIVGAVFAADALSHPGSAGAGLPTPAAAESAQPTPTARTPRPIATSELTETADLVGTDDNAGSIRPGDDSGPGSAQGGDDIGRTD